jgi:hypothetical protein
MKDRSILKLVLSFLLLIILLSQMVTPVGCANIIPPGGGPRDSLPPVLLGLNPPDSTKNFAGKRIVFQFDEFVEIDNPRENLLVSPLPKIDPVVEARLRTVTVTIKDTLQPNVTYTIDFGNAIKDINEGNPFKNFKYIFTTGEHFDSLEVSGNVVVAETGGIDTTLIVMLHSVLDDSAIIKERPKYIARLQNDGRFYFENLPPGTFAIYALKDAGGQRRYLDTTVLFAFADSTINTAASPAPITLYAYAAGKADPNQASSVTTGSPAPPRRQQREGAVDRLTFTTNIQSEELDLLGNLDLVFGTRIRDFDSTKIRLTNEKFESLSGYRFIRDTGNTKISVVHRWIENTPYHLVFEKDFITDTANRTLQRNDTVSFRTKQARAYGEIRMRLLNLDLSKNPVLQFVQNNEVKYSYPLTTRAFNARLFVPGDYDLRILFDENKNGKWDPGVFFKNRRQPEKVMPISRKLTVKANWLNELDITL